MINKEKATLMRAWLEASLTTFEEHFGVAVSIGNIRFTENHAKIPLEISQVTEEGEVISKEAEDYKNYAANYGLRPEWLGESFTGRGKVFTIIGLNTRAKKYKIHAKCDDGKIYKFHHRSIQLSMEKA